MCSIPGVYILQWKYKSGVPVGQAHARHNRAKVMFYYELLSSGDFRYVCLLSDGATKKISDINLSILF